MNQLDLLILVLHFMFFHVKAQYPGGNSSKSFIPFIGFISIMFFFLLSLLLTYAKFFHRRGPVHNNPQNFALFTLSSRFSGIDKTVIESLPFFRFSSLKGTKEGLECAVCLSKFEDTEILRLLPKCKHAFHIDCIDNWLEKHSSCPLCRHKVSANDIKNFTYTNSMRLINQSELRQDSNIELFIQREEDHHGSSRFSIGSSFRKTERGNNNEEKQLIQEEADNSIDENQKVLHKHNHKIIVSDFVFKNRWSNLSSSDLMFLNSEMLGATSSYRFSSFDLNNDQSSALENEHIVKIKEETGIKRLFENEVNALNKTSPVSFPGLPSTSDSTSNVSQTSRYVNPTERRSMSEITALSRYEDSGMKNRIIGESSLLVNNVKAERMRQLWLPIARRTVQWYAKRERRSQQSQNIQQVLNV